jgi:hypothetical protein
MYMLDSVGAIASLAKNHTPAPYIYSIFASGVEIVIDDVIDYYRKLAGRKQLELQGRRVT